MPEPEWTHTLELNFVVESDNPTRPTDNEIITTIRDLLDQAPDYLTSAKVVHTGRS